MKKFLFSVLALVAMMTIFSFSVVGAQEEEEAEALPSCSAEDYVANVEAIGEAFTGLGELTVLPEAPTASDLSANVAILDAFAYTFWETFDPEAISCAEELYIGQTAGTIFDELVIVSVLNALAVHEEAAGNADAAAVLLEQSTTRGELLQEELTTFGETINALIAGEEVELDVVYDYCGEEDLAAISEGLTAINTVYQELATLLGEGATGLDLTALVAGYAELSAGYWNEFTPVVPECYEAQVVAYDYGFLLDETLMTVGLLRLAELEAEAGNAELSESLAASALARLEYLQEMSAALIGDGTEEEAE